MESKNHLIISMVPMHLGLPWASCNTLYASKPLKTSMGFLHILNHIYRRHFI